MQAAAREPVGGGRDGAPARQIAVRLRIVVEVVGVRQLHEPLREVARVRRRHGAGGDGADELFTMRRWHLQRRQCHELLGLWQWQV